MTLTLTCWVLGEYPTHVFASATAFVPEIAANNDHDTAVFTMKFPSGALSMTDLSRNARLRYDQRLEVFGPKGMVSGGNERPFPLITCSVQGETQPPAYYSFPSRYHQSYIRELDHLLRRYSRVRMRCGWTFTFRRGIDHYSPGRLRASVFEIARLQ
ncbi:Myo-inositol 2-dehydrogenase [Chionoecetes opilio]|uniref:Myo-inositol 2-dehydrogenase n=1 Tax=Chionoecetes opilio TaxID=41210 RepID=A0A8J4Y887_CHIOP|nr:Myo-inositol 2-dehydrogenase [Chionoecetes opilio]KAG0721963.1 Myo-inositol 2-dehydrogenase [Chionoecetes opilio]